MHDVVVVGGGPAGMHAAGRLARRGRDVLVIEEDLDPGDPVHCTGVLAREAFDEFDLTRDVILNELTTARFVSPRGHVLLHRTRNGRGGGDRSAWSRRPPGARSHPLGRAAPARAPGHGHFHPGRRRERAPCGRQHRPRTPVRAGHRRPVCPASAGRSRAARHVPPYRPAGAARRPAGGGRAPLRPGRRARRVRLGRAGLAGRRLLRARRGDGRARRAHLLRPHARAHFGPMGHAGPERRPAPPEDPAPGQPGSHLSRPADCRRRRGRPGQADHGRRHLLRAVERRDRRRGGRSRPRRGRADGAGPGRVSARCGSAA